MYTLVLNYVEGLHCLVRIMALQLSAWSLLGTKERAAWAGLRSSAMDHTPGHAPQTRGNPYGLLPRVLVHLHTVEQPSTRYH
jgi:hypothetical protein